MNARSSIQGWTRLTLSLLGPLTAATGGARLAAQAGPVTRLVAEPASLVMRAGERKPLKITAYDAKGQVVPDPGLTVFARRVGTNEISLGAVAYDDGVVTATQPGDYLLLAIARTDAETRVQLEIRVSVSWPALARVAIRGELGRKLYVGVMRPHRLEGWHADSSEREKLAAIWKSSNPTVATVDRFGTVTALKTGSVTLSAEAEGLTAKVSYEVAPNPVATVEVVTRETVVRTGDVIHLRATPRRADGGPVTDIPIVWSYSYQPDDSIKGHGGPALIQDSLFAANAPGRYTLFASAGNVRGATVIEAQPRDVRRAITVTGRGLINETHTADLWPWTGKDGRDYCLVGKYGVGMAQVFDITDLNNIVRTDSIAVDARVVNDVTVSPDGRYGVIAREGASNRINGVVLLDLSTPAHPTVAATFEQELTGGVHNTFATNDYLFAVSGGQKYVIIDVRDIYHPKYVSEYHHPNAYLHDLWVHDGIAYSAQGGAGTVVVDVGNGKYGGTIEKPKLITVYPIDSGHEIFPYFQRSTGKVYLFIGDEEGRDTRAWQTAYWRGRGLTSEPRGSVAMDGMMGGYTHIVDFTDPMNPKAVATYHIEDYGTHDIIVEDDVLYQAYYDGGVRVVDVSGELLGNLAEQGREIAVLKPLDPQGYMANAPMVMNAMPWKGHVLFTDFNSGLWAARLEPKKKAIP